MPIAAAAEPAASGAQQEYWAQFDRKDWSAAVTAAEQLVAAERARMPAEPLELAEALSMLGNAQFGKGDYATAERTFSEALDIAERHSTPTSENLLNPLRGLGFTHAATGRHDAAVPVLERALLVSHRTLGLFDISQQGVLRQLALSLTRLGRAEDAERHMQYLLRVTQRTYAEDDPRSVPNYLMVADWYADVGNFYSAREIYRACLQIVGTKLGSKDLAAVEPLRALARSYTQELYYSTLGVPIRRDRLMGASPYGAEQVRPLNPRALDSDGERALQRALEILDTHPQPPADILVATLIQTGDWYQTKSQPDKAVTYYRRAWTLQTAEPDRSGRALLSFPVRIYYATPPTAVRNMHLGAEQSEQRFVHVEFTVTRDGDVKDERIVEENASSRQKSETLDALRTSRYRPKFVDGEPVDTSAMSFREVFKVRRKKDGDEEAEADS